MRNAIVSFDNTEIAFSGKSNKDLNGAYWLFKILSYNWLVKISPPFVNLAIRSHLPVKGLIKETIYKHFCGGETIDECQKTINELAKYNIGTILDYSVEGKESEADFESALRETLLTIRRAKGDKHIPFAVFKPTVIARLGLLEKINAKGELNTNEEGEFERVKDRFETICKTGYENNVCVLIDAEQSWIQNVVDTLATEMMTKYNREHAIVYNTIQMYRTDRLDFLYKAHEHAYQNNYFLGVKVVRGAYMEKERKRASLLNQASPIQATKEATDDDYNAALRFCMNNLEEIFLCAGTHNEYSSLLLTELMKEKDLLNNHPHISFSQLYGMSDDISYNLSTLGYNVCKYVPYGPITGVLPYLIRRAQENTSVSGQVGRELSLILTEKKRRAVAKVK
jgi:proline dehydrogenase